jgi:superfamily II DNA or RNA helicase
MLIEKKIPYRIRQRTNSHQCAPILESKISFEEHPYGLKAVEKILKKRTGVLQAPTGSGKTVIAIETIVRRNERALVVVHTKELMYQWRDRILQFTNLKAEEIGLIGDGKKQLGLVTIGIIDSLRKITQPLIDQIGYVIVDECHRVPSTTFPKFIVKMNTKFILGLSATPYRRDGLTQVIHFFMGDTVHVIKTKMLQKQGHIIKPDLKLIKTDFSPHITSTREYVKVLKKLTEDEDRNTLILHNIHLQAKKNSGIILVISDRKGHCNLLFEKINPELNPVLLTGSSTPSQRQKALEMLNNGEAGALVATKQLVGEGLDVPHLSSIFLTTPIKWKGSLIQFIGRILRTAEGKENALIVDFEDPCWLLKGSLNSRMKGYKEMGIL